MSFNNKKENKNKVSKVKETLRYFRLAILDNKEINKSEKGIGAAKVSISMKSNPINAAKKLMKAICKHQGLKKMNKLKCNALFYMREEKTNGDHKIHGPYKGTYISLMKNGKEKIVKLKNGTIIKYTLKPVVKKYKENINKSLQKKVNYAMKGGTYPFYPLINNDNMKNLIYTGHIICDIAVFSDGNRVVSAGYNENNQNIVINNNIKIWNSFTKECLHTLVGHTGRVSSVRVFSEDNFIVSGSWDHTVKIWNTSTGECIKTFSGHVNMVNSVAVIGDGERIISGSEDKTVKIWEFSSGTCLNTLSGHTDGVLSVAVIGDGKRIVSGSDDNTIKIWNISTGICLMTLSGHTDGVLSVVVIGNEERIVSRSRDSNVKIWDLSSRTCIHTFSGHNGKVKSVAVISHTGRIVSGSGDGTVKIWDSYSEDCLQTLTTPNNSPVMSIAVSSNGKKIFCGSYNGSIKIWNFVKKYTIE